MYTNVRCLDSLTYTYAFENYVPQSGIPPFLGFFFMLYNQQHTANAYLNLACLKYFCDGLSGIGSVLVVVGP